MIKEKFYWESWKETLKESNTRSRVLNTYGVSFLDDVGFINDESFVVIGADAGTGKTQLALKIALENSRCGRKVLAIFLEAGRRELQRRYRLQKLCELYFKAPGKKEYVDISPANYYAGVLDDQFGRFEKEVEGLWEIETSKMTIVTKKEGFGIEELIEALERASHEKFDLIIIDHIHHFDYDLREESQMLSEILHKMDITITECQIPIVLFGQFRKDAVGKPKKFKSHNDFHGTAKISRLPTEIFTITRGDPVENGFETFISVLKGRGQGKTGSVARMIWSMAKQDYLPSYTFGKVEKDKFEEVTAPKWAKRAKNR